MRGLLSGRGQLGREGCKQQRDRKMTRCCNRIQKRGALNERVKGLGNEKWGEGGGILYIGRRNSNSVGDLATFASHHLRLVRLQKRKYKRTRNDNCLMLSFWFLSLCWRGVGRFSERTDGERGRSLLTDAHA